MFTASLRKSAFNWPGYLKLVVMPDNVREIKWFKSLYTGLSSFKVRVQMSNSASLSIQNVASVLSTSWSTDKVVLYGSTTTSDTWKEISQNFIGSSLSFLFAVGNCKLICGKVEYSNWFERPYETMMNFHDYISTYIPTGRIWWQLILQSYSED